MAGFLQRARQAVRDTAAGLFAPFHWHDDSQPAARDHASRRYAPELPSEVLRKILLPLAGDMRTMCAAACVSTSWHAAALHPRLWRKLHADRDGHLIAKTTTDSRLKLLVRRACGVDAEGNEHKLVSLCVSFAPVTLRGVLAALRGPRNADGTPLLHGALRTLRVSGLPFPEGDEKKGKLTRDLSSFVRPPRPDGHSNFDLLGGMTPCTATHDGEACGRAASLRTHWCVLCDSALCRQCCIYNPTACNCENMCEGCGCCHEPLFLCSSCRSSGSSHRHFCKDCMCVCCGDCDPDAFDGGHCLECATFCDYRWCDGDRCKPRVYCNDCSNTYVAQCDGELCSREYCTLCQDEHLVEVGERADGKPRLLCQICRRAVQPAADALQGELQDHTLVGYCISSDEEDEAA